MQISSHYASFSAGSRALLPHGDNVDDGGGGDVLMTVVAVILILIVVMILSMMVVVVAMVMGVSQEGDGSLIHGLVLPQF